MAILASMHSGSAEFRATVNRISDAEAVERMIDDFYDPLIARGATRVTSREQVMAEAA